MITLPELAAQDLGSFLASDTKDRFGTSHARLAEILPFAARLALDCIGNSDALYHNVEHTMLVTLADHEIFKGRALLMPVTPTDYSNFIVACLTHDIGYIRGIVKGDDAKGYVVDGTGRKISLPRRSSDAALAPYHVERSKLFVLDRVVSSSELDAARIARLLVSGFAMVLLGLGGFLAVGAYVRAMMALGIVMVIIYIYLYFVPWQRFRRAVSIEDWPAANATLQRMRFIVGVNLILGLVTIVVGASGRYYG
jgi:uncharacterized membrane protein